MESHFLAGILRPFFWLVMAGVLATILWAIRRFLTPHLSAKWERILFRKL